MISKEELFSLIPPGWSGVTLEDYMNIVSSNKVSNEHVNEINTLSILTGIDTTNPVYYTLTKNEMRLIGKKLSWIKILPKGQKKEIEIDGYKYKLIDFNTMLVSEYLLLDYYATNDIVNNLHRISAMLYRRHTKNEFNNEIKEPLEFDFEERSELFLEQSMSSVYAIELFLEFRLRIQSMFPFCFNKVQVDEEELKEEEDIISKMNFRERAIYKEEKRKEQLELSFSWEYLILEISKDNIVDAHKIYDFEILYIFQMINALRSRN